MMQDWLSDHGLDRKTLEGLTRNALQHYQYLHWQEGQGG
jgi:hypothetical protein